MQRRPGPRRAAGERWGWKWLGEVRLFCAGESGPTLAYGKAGPRDLASGTTAREGGGFGGGVGEEAGVWLGRRNGELKMIRAVMENTLE